MGQSLLLIKKDFLELSLEIDRNVSLEMGTGFGISNTTSVALNMPITIAELKEVIDKLTKLHGELTEAWACPNCNAINRKDWTVCDTCEVERQ